MRLPPFRYRAPRTVADAALWLAESPGDTMLVAGGTDLLPNMKRRQQTPKTMIGLRGIEELSRIGAGNRQTADGEGPAPAPPRPTPDSRLSPPPRLRRAGPTPGAIWSTSATLSRWRTSSIGPCVTCLAASVNA